MLGCVVRFGLVAIALLPSVQALTKREREFLNCIITQTTSPKYRDYEPSDVCYAKCYSSAANPPERYSTREFAAGAHLFLNHEHFNRRGFRGYVSQDWHGEPLDPMRGTTPSEMELWTQQYETGFFAFSTTRGLSVSNADHKLSNLKHAQMTHSIRVTIRIKNVPHRAMVLWHVITDMCDVFMPEWFKIDTPGAEREDSLIMMFHESVNPRKIADLSVEQRLQSTYLDVISHIEEDSLKIGGNTVALRDLLEHGGSLPPFQFQKDGHSYASVADYFYGASFGETLCKHMTHRWTSEGFRRQILLSLEDENLGVVGLWKQHFHPTTKHWNFQDPQDQNFAVVLAKNSGENPEYDVEHLDVSKFLRVIKKLARLEEDVATLIATD